MPAPQAEGEPPDTGDVLGAEQAYLLESRKFLGLMRDDVLSLQALGGDPVSEEYLRATLFQRAEALQDLPDTPLFFGRLDYGAPEETSTGQTSAESFHIGRRHVHDPQAPRWSSTGARRCPGRFTRPAGTTRWAWCCAAGSGSPAGS